MGKEWTEYNVFRFPVEGSMEIGIEKDGPARRWMFLSCEVVDRRPRIMFVRTIEGVVTGSIARTPMKFRRV